MALRRHRYTEEPNFELLKTREAHHIGVEFDTGVVDQALAIINEGTDHERQYYDLLALARRYAEPLEITGCLPTPTSDLQGEMCFARLMNRVDVAIERHVTPKLVDMTPDTVAYLGFSVLGGVAVMSVDVLAEQPIALAGFVGFATMFASFVAQLREQRRTI